MNPFVDLLAQLGALRLADPRHPHPLHQLTPPPRQNTADPGFLDHRHQRLLRYLPRLQERREVAALPQLRDPQLKTAQSRIKHPITMAVAPRRALAISLVAPGADQPFHVPFHQQLPHRIRHSSQKIAVTRLLQQLGQRQSLLGHRILSWQRLKLRNSTLSRQGRWPPPPTPSRHTAARAESPPSPRTLTDCQRQWHSADLVRHPALAAGAWRAVALHRPRQADAERLCRELHRAIAR